jgi:hypothetical protein
LNNKIGVFETEIDESGISTEKYGNGDKSLFYGERCFC